MTDLYRQIEVLDDVETHRAAPLGPYTTFRIGGPADLLVIPRNGKGLRTVVRCVRRLGLELLVIGAGSDLLIPDRGFRGVALKIPSGLEEVRIDDAVLIADAGRPLPELMRRARRAGLSGLEFAGGIPGSLGGSLAVNAGAWGRDMAGVAQTITGVTERGETVTIPAGEIGWSYRAARFPEPLVITEATLGLEPADPAVIATREEEWHEARRLSQPLGAPSAGCVFRNPAAGEAGRLIETAGLKGTRIGGAAVSAVHANFIVNDGGASAEDVVRLIDQVRERVRVVHGVELELEIKVLGTASNGAGAGGGGKPCAPHGAV